MIDDKAELINKPGSLLELSKLILEFAEHGDYSNGNEAFGLDEGRVLARETLQLYRRELEKYEGVE